ncbi:hypothetical protein F4553_007451 [Allocatelliglobosispora scoriae]|uniref:Uncharacterized protein n=1 Tax=Allocatelliglobosispora scoriae TaxID=643052 RepID=A0A841BXY7_9ACTN|nr:hypothetical protein [Allocatelliglobosispora scoriae]
MNRGKWASLFGTSRVGLNEAADDPAQAVGSDHNVKLWSASKEVSWNTRTTTLVIIASGLRRGRSRPNNGKSDDR